MTKCENCGKEIETFLTVKGQKFCVECAVKKQKEIDTDNLGYTACI